MKRRFGTGDSRSMMRSGMICLLLFHFSNFLLRRWVGDSWRDLVEGLSGVALGAAIAFLLLAARSNGRRRRGAEAEPCE